MKKAKRTAYARRRDSRREGLQRRKSERDRIVKDEVRCGEASVSVSQLGHNPLQPSRVTLGDVIDFGEIEAEVKT